MVYKVGCLQQMPSAHFGSDTCEVYLPTITFLFNLQLIIVLALVIPSEEKLIGRLLLVQETRVLIAI